MRRLLAIVLGLGAAIYVATPPAARGLPATPAGLAAPVRGAIHVHTRRSDGSGTVEQIASAASRAGLRFVVLTDHGDATRRPTPPEYHEGVLMIDAVEISTDHGHLLALNLPPAPYPLGGEARDVVDDIERMGGFALAAHPASLKPDLAWTDWDVRVGGLEHLNGDSEWRDESPWRLARALLAYPMRPAETLVLLFDRSEAVLKRWDALTQQRRVVAIAGADAHARLDLTGASEPYRGRFGLPVPAYESLFRAFSVALPQAQLSSDPVVDAGRVFDEIRAGRVFSSVDALGRHPAFAFAATSGASRAVGGEVLPLQGPVRLEVNVQAPPDVQIALVRDGAPLREASGASLQYEAEPVAAVYRVEVKVPGAPGNPPVPWIVSNPIYVGRSSEDARAPGPRPAPQTKTVLYADGQAPDWTVEHSSESRGALDVVKAVEGTQLLLRYAIAGPESSHPFAALAAPAGTALVGHDRISFRARADRTMRVSVQLRAPGSDAAGERWHRSVFVDTNPREISVFFDEMTPRGPTSTPKPTLEKIRSILFVVDTVNTRAGTSGQLFLDDVRYER